MIYFDGDSHTYGEELERPQDQSFATVLSKKLGHDFINLAVSGCSNDEIMRRVYRQLDHYRATGTRPDLIVIGWTEVDRETWWVNGSGRSVDTYMLMGEEAKNMDPGRLDRFRTNVKYNGIYIAAMTHYWYNQVYNLHCELEHMKIPHLFFHGCRNWMLKWNDISSWNIVKMHDIHEYDWNRCFIRQRDPNFSLLQWAWENGYPTTRYDHIDAYAHVQWAKLLYEYIETNQLMSVYSSSTTSQPS